MKSSVITFPGSNCDRDMDVALKKFGFNNKMVWHNDNELPKSDLIVLPGGFSYGDVMGAGHGMANSILFRPKICIASPHHILTGTPLNATSVATPAAVKTKLDP